MGPRHGVPYASWKPAWRTMAPTRMRLHNQPAGWRQQSVWTWRWCWFANFKWILHPAFLYLTPFPFISFIMASTITSLHTDPKVLDTKRWNKKRMQNEKRNLETPFEYSPRSKLQKMYLQADGIRTSMYLYPSEGDGSWPILKFCSSKSINRCSGQDWCNLYGLQEKYCRRMFIIPPPSLASAFPLDRNFSKGVRFWNKNFPEVAPQKNVSAYFSPNYYTAPVPWLRPWSRSSGCVFDISGQWWPGAYMIAHM